LAYIFIFHNNYARIVTAVQCIINRLANCWRNQARRHSIYTAHFTKYWPKVA